MPWIGLVGPILSFLGGLSGGLLALRRHRSQQAFDRRAEWHERAFATLSAMASLEREFAIEIAHPSSPGRLGEISERMQELGRERRHVLDEAALYASTEVDAAIRQAAHTMMSFYPRGQRITVENSLELANRATEDLQTAMQVLVDDYRSHMRLKPRDHSLGRGR